MKVRYHVEGRLPAAVQAVVERELTLLDARLATFEDDLKSLDATVRHQALNDTFVAKLVPRLPSRTIAVTGSGPWRPAALRDAFDDLRDGFDEHLAKQRGEPALRRCRERAWYGEGCDNRDRGARLTSPRDRSGVRKRRDGPR